MTHTHMVVNQYLFLPCFAAKNYLIHWQSSSRMNISPIITRRSGLHQFIIKSIRTWSTASEILNVRASSGFPPIDYLCFVKALTTLEFRLVASKRHPRLGCNCQKVGRFELKVWTLSCCQVHFSSSMFLDTPVTVTLFGKLFWIEMNIWIF